MKTPYGVISDSHHHSWSAFATTLESGVNSRMQMLLDETNRCAKEVREAGGNVIVHAGDLFHVRGSIAPSVLNPTLDCYKALIRVGFKIVILAGNHDLEGKDSNRIGSAITALEGIGCMVINEPTYNLGAGIWPELVMVPWHKDLGELKEVIEMTDPLRRPSCDLIIHAPIDGVIMGIPDHGLDAAYLGGLGYRRVFSGHYHNHKDFGNGVYSIGALAHHTWSDVGSKAGFLVVSDKEVKWFKSHAPEFIDIAAEMDPDDIELLVDGNFVRARINSTKVSDINALRDMMTKAGAKGVTVMAQKALAAASREGGTLVKEGATLSASVTDYIKSQGFGREADLTLLCSKILLEVSEVTA